MSKAAEVSIEKIGLTIVKRNWFFYLLMGILLIVLGTIAIGRSCLATQVSMIFLGWLMIAAGVSQTIYAFWKERDWGGFFFDILSGILYAVVGFMIVANPASTAVTLTLLIAMYLLFDGIFRIVGAISIRFPHWGWIVLSGIVSVLLGISIWRQWPYSGLWVIGLFVGIQMIFNGWSTVMLGLTAKRLPDSLDESTLT